MRHPGGIIVFHDIVEKQPFETNHVHAFWYQQKQDYSVEGFIENPGEMAWVSVACVSDEGQRQHALTFNVTNL